MKIKMTVSQQLIAVRKNTFTILEIETPHIAAVIEAVSKNPQLADNVARKLPYDYIAKHFKALERIIVTAAKQSSFTAKNMRIPHYFWTYAVYAQLAKAGADVGKYPAPKSCLTF